MSTELTKHTLFELDKMMIRKNFWTIFGAKFRLFDMNDVLVAASKQKAFKLKEDIRVFTDESLTEELLTMNARKIVDFGAAYDVVDAVSGEKVGAMRRKGWKSIFKDEWRILDNNDEQVGSIKEDSAGMAFLRRFLSNLIPQTFHIHFDDEMIGTIKQHFNPFIFKATLDLTADRERAFDRRLAIGAVVLLLAIEGRQR